MFMDFLMQNWLAVVIFLVLIVYAIYLTVTRQWTSVRELAYQLMLLAERNLKDQEGKIKFDFVVVMVYRSLPGWMKIFIKEDDISELVQTWYDKAKDFLDDGQINNSTATKLGKF